MLWGLINFNSSCIKVFASIIIHHVVSGVNFIYFCIYFTKTSIYKFINIYSFCDIKLPDRSHDFSFCISLFHLFILCYKLYLLSTGSPHESYRWGSGYSRRSCQAASRRRWWKRWNRWRNYYYASLIRAARYQLSKIQHYRLNTNMDTGTLHLP